MGLEFKKIRTGRLSRLILWISGTIWSILTYFTAQRRFDRQISRRVLTKQSISEAKKMKDAYWKAKQETGRIQIQHGGTITTDKPFPPRGSLLTDEERKDPLAL